MSYTEFISNCISLCRICLAKSSNMNSLENKFNSEKDSPTILEVLEETIGEKINCDTRYPPNICCTCINSMKCLVDVGIKDVFWCSQNILEKYVLVKPIALETIKAAEKSESLTDNESSEEMTRKDKTKIKQTWPTCNYCHVPFRTTALVKSHLTECKKINKCHHCDEIMPTKKMLRSHLELKHDEHMEITTKEYKCDKCDVVLRSAYSLANHKFTRHYSKEKTYSCKICKKSFMLRNNLRLHMRSHTKGVSRIVCPICERSFRHSGGLFSHMKIHVNEGKYL